MDGTPTGDKLPIALRMPEEKLALVLLIAGFIGLVILLLGAAAGMWIFCAAGAAVLVLTALWAFGQRRTEIVVQTDRITVRTPWSEQDYPYEGKNLLLRRSWAVTNRRLGTFGMGLADVAIQLRQGSRPVVTIPVSWRGSRGFGEAMTFLESLPIQKRYL